MDFEIIKKQCELVRLGRNEEETMALEAVINTSILMHYEHKKITEQERDYLLSYMEKVCWNHEESNFVSPDTIGKGGVL